MPDGGRRYFRDFLGRAGGRARYVKEVDAAERTIRFAQEIYDQTGRLVAVHEKFPVDEGRSRSTLPDDNSPLRKLFLAENDILIYTLAKNFFFAVDALMWQHAGERAYIRRTVGIQALFDVLRVLASDAVEKKDVSNAFFTNQLSHTDTINFSDPFFTQASGKGRTRIRNAILVKIGRLRIDDMGADLEEYKRVTA